MTKEQYIQYWIELAKEDMETVEVLINGKRNLMTLFTLNLVVEKLLKAAWVKDNMENVPPKTHNLQLLAKQTKLSFSENTFNYLAVITSWNIEARYPDYKKRVYQIANEEYVNDAFEKVTKIKLWMLEQLQ